MVNAEVNNEETPQGRNGPTEALPKRKLNQLNNCFDKITADKTDKDNETTEEFKISIMGLEEYECEESDL